MAGTDSCAREPADEASRVVGHTHKFEEYSPQFLAAVTNFGIQYNYGSAGIATAIMLSHGDLTGANLTPDFPQPLWAKHFLLSVVFVGSILGMLTMGPLGDLIGVRRALIFTNSLVAVGALCSALLSWGSITRIWAMIMVGRFILGVGVGGCYPLSAAKAAQGANGDRSIEHAASAFFWQGPGALAPYVVALLLLKLLPARAGVTSIQFRVILALGALPALVVVWCSFRASDLLTSPSPSARPARGCNALVEAVSQPKYFCSLVGTAGSWFLFDVAMYAVVIFAPTILMYVFGPDGSLYDVAFHAMMFAGMIALGNAAGLWFLKVHGGSAKMLCVGGFVAAAALFAAVAVIFGRNTDNQDHTLLFILLAAIFGVLSSGPGIGTFVLPVEAFPKDLLGTFGGISAASGKVGAMIGVIVFPLLVDNFGMDRAMGLMGGVCLAGAILTQFCLRCLDGESQPLLHSGRPSASVEAQTSMQTK